MLSSQVRKRIWTTATCFRFCMHAQEVVAAVCNLGAMPHGKDMHCFSKPDLGSLMCFYRSELSSWWTMRACDEKHLQARVIQPRKQATQGSAGTRRKAAAAQP